MGGWGYKNYNFHIFIQVTYLIEIPNDPVDEVKLFETNSWSSKICDDSFSVRCGDVTKVTVAKACKESDGRTPHHSIFNRPGVAGAVLQSPPLLIN